MNIVIDAISGHIPPSREGRDIRTTYWPPNPTTARLMTVMASSACIDSIYRVPKGNQITLSDPGCEATQGQTLMHGLSRLTFTREKRRRMYLVHGGSRCRHHLLLFANASYPLRRQLSPEKAWTDLQPLRSRLGSLLVSRQGLRCTGNRDEWRAIEAAIQSQSTQNATTLRVVCLLFHNSESNRLISDNV